MSRDANEVVLTRATVPFLSPGICMIDERIAVNNKIISVHC